MTPSLIEPQDAVWRWCQLTFILATCWFCSRALGRGGPSRTPWSNSWLANFTGTNDTKGHFQELPPDTQLGWATTDEADAPRHEKNSGGLKKKKKKDVSSDLTRSQWYEILKKFFFFTNWTFKMMQVLHEDCFSLHLNLTNVQCDIALTLVCATFLSSCLRIQNWPATNVFCLMWGGYKKYGVCLHHQNISDYFIQLQLCLSRCIKE